MYYQESMECPFFWYLVIIKNSYNSYSSHRCNPVSVCFSLMVYNFSGVSLSEMDSQGLAPPKARLYEQRPHTGQAEFRGLALPVDINMIFEVWEFFID